MNIVKIITTAALLMGISASSEFHRATREPHSADQSAHSLVKPNTLDSNFRLPITFVPNAGQIDARVRFTAQTGGAHFYFTSNEVVSVLNRKKNGVVLHLKFLGANRDPEITGAQPTAARINYLTGPDPTRWHTGLSTYNEVIYHDVWPGIDLVFRSEKSDLKYEFHVAPEANPNHIRLAYRGAKRLSIDREGNLKIHTTVGVLSDYRPTSYQITANGRIPVASRYTLGGNGYGFAVSAYDRSRPLIIDPGLDYSTFLGGNADAGLGVAVDAAGNAYVTGETGASNFPTTTGAFDETFNGGTSSARGDVFVTKLNPSGTALVYSTYVGGSANEAGTGITVDAAGNAYVTGSTLSSNFPTTPGAFDTSYNGGLDAFVTKLDPTGSFLAYSTYLGGSLPGLPCTPLCPDDAGAGIAVDTSGNAYVTGGTRSRDFPTTTGAFDTSYTIGAGSHVFVTKLNLTGSALIYSTYLGGESIEEGSAIAVDTSGNAYVTGVTSSNAYPTTPEAFDTIRNGGQDAFVTTLNADGTALVYSTFLGGSLNDQGDGISIDAIGNVYLAGFSASNNFPTTLGAFDTALSGTDDMFVAKLHPGDSDLVYSTYLGGSGREICGQFGRGLVSRFCWGIAVDAEGSAYVAGSTTSDDFPTTASAFDTTYNGGNCNTCGDAFMTKLNAIGSAALYSTYLGGPESDSGRAIAIDASKGVYMTGSTTSSTFPTTVGAFRTIGGGFFGDAFVLSLKNQLPSATDDTITTDEEIAATMSLAANDVDPDGDLLVVSNVTQGTNGSVVLNPDNSVTYSPATNFNGTDSFTYTITDAWGETESATVNVNVTPVNDAPVASDDSYSTIGNSTLVVNAPGVLTNDADIDGDGLSAVLVTSVSNGTLALATDGSFTYTPNLNFSGADSFTYRAFDGTANSDTVTVQITVTTPPPTPTPTPTPTPVPCQQEGQCFVFNYLGHNTAANGQTTISFSVTNKCKNPVRMVAIGTDSFTRIAPADNSVYTGALGNYDIGWTRATGNPGFVSIKFEPGSKNFKNGATDVFSIIVSDFNPNTSIQVKGVGPSQETFVFLLSQTACPALVSGSKIEGWDTFTSYCFRLFMPPRQWFT